MIIVGLGGTAACDRQKEGTLGLDETASGPRHVASATARSTQASAEFNPRLLRRFMPIRPVLAANPAAVSDEMVILGRTLFFDHRLSKNQQISCNSCHRLDQYGMDGRQTSVGHKGQIGRRNAPTVYHAAAFAVQLWDGRSGDVETQARGPMLNPTEMAMPDAAAVERVLRSIPGYLPVFQAAFPDDPNPVTLENATRAIGAFERKLATPSRWDRFLRGDQQALTALETEGLKTFTNIGCMVCHTGEVLGGTSFQRVGAVEPWPNQLDQGRYEITKAPADRMMFKVPTLRNVEKTAPYFHDGSIATLAEAVSMMGRHQLGLDLDSREVAAIVAWLGALTGDLPKAYIAAPTLPESSATTPPADPT